MQILNFTVHQYKALLNMELFTLGFERQIMLTERKMSAVLATAPHLQLLQKSPIGEALLLTPHSMLVKRE